MKWFDKWFAKKCKHVWENHNQLLQDTPPDTIYKQSIQTRIP